MNNKQLALRLTALLNDCEKWCLTEDESEFYYCGIDGSGYYSVPVIDYMDWNILMPIAIEHGVSWVPFDGGHESYTKLYVGAYCDYDIRKFDKTPQIAIVKCLIAKLESENVNVR